MCSLLALDRVAEVVKAYKEMIQEIPNDTFPDVYAKMGLAATKAAAGVLPDLMEKVFSQSFRTSIDGHFKLTICSILC